MEPALLKEQPEGHSANFGSHGIQLKVEREHAEILIHTPNEKVNKLTRAAFEELFKHLLFLKNKSHEIKTLLIYSDKNDMFLAGADIQEIRSMKDRGEALALVQKAQEVFQTLADLPQVTMVAIDGVCLGGGCELALACQYRICSDSRSTLIGLPEIKLGVLPGAGGTQRLPRVVGLQAALEIILAGGAVDSRKALKIGLVSDVVPKERLLEFARKSLRGRLYTRYFKKESIFQALLETAPFKNIVFRKAKALLMEKTKGNYPAPLRALEVIQKTFYIKDIREGLKIEAEAFADLAITPEAKNLIHLFYSSEEMKRDRGVHANEALDFRPRKVEATGVIGAGIMGGGIAAVASAKGISVRLKDVNHESILKGLKTAHDLFSKDLKRKKIEKAEYKKRLYRLSPTLQFSGFGHLPIVIEAVIEKMDIKKQVFAELDRILPPEAIIASNTSSLSIGEMASSTKRADKVVGMHFFNPVPKMPLVEVIRAEKTSPETVIQTLAFGRQLGKTLIVVKDRPGFLVNRILMPFLIECGHLREEGYSIAQIDQAAVRFGMPMGPFRLLDEVGLDTGAKVARVIATAYPHMKVLPLIDEMVNKNYLGKKNSRGFYSYDLKGKELAIREEFQSDPKDANAETDQYLQDRLIFPMLSEAILALDEGIVATVRDLDIGLIFGIGFPPFRGGLLKWASDVGERQILDRLNSVHNATKGRILVPSTLVARVQQGQKFYHEN